MQNRQIILRIRQGDTRREDCWKVRTALTKALHDSPLHVNDRDVYAIVEPTPSNHERNRSIGKALFILEEMIPATQRAGIVLDFRAGIAYFSENGANSDVNRYVTLGRTDPKQGWVWLEKALNETFNDMNFALLCERTADALAR